MFSRLFSTSSKPLHPDQIGADVSLLTRINNRIKYYIENEAPPGIFGIEGRHRAEKYMRMLNRLVIRKNDSALFVKVLNDVDDEFGEGHLGSSLRLRMSLIYALSEHFNIPKSDIRKALRRSITNNMNSMFANLVEQFQQFSIHGACEVLRKKYNEQILRSSRSLLTKSCPAIFYQ